MARSFFVAPAAQVCCFPIISASSLAQVCQLFPSLLLPHWRRSAETLQAGATVRSVRQIPGAGLRNSRRRSVVFPSFLLPHWRRSAESLQASATVRPVRQIPGAGLRTFCRLAPKTLQTSAIVRSVRQIPGAGLVLLCVTPRTNCKDLARLCPWPGPFLSPPRRRSAETLQTGATVHPVRQIPGAGLPAFCRLAPKTPQTSARNITDLHQNHCRPAPLPRQ